MGPVTLGHAVQCESRLVNIQKPVKTNESQPVTVDFVNLEISHLCTISGIKNMYFFLVVYRKAAEQSMPVMAGHQPYPGMSGFVVEFTYYCES